MYVCMYIFCIHEVARSVQDIIVEDSASFVT